LGEKMNVPFSPSIGWRWQLKSKIENRKFLQSPFQLAFVATLC